MNKFRGLPFQLFSLLVIILGLSVQCLGQGRANNNALKAEVLGAKALLEELLVRRYSQDLGSIVEKQNFNLSSQLDLIQVPKTQDVAKTIAAKELDPISDLSLGYLDPEEIIRRYMPPKDESKVQGFLENFKIKKVAITVGLKKDLGEEVKATVNTWLTQRIKDEFGENGSGNVVFLNEIVAPKKEVPEKTNYEKLQDFQELAGQIAMALAVLLAVILYSLLAKKESGSSPLTIQNQMTASEKDSQAKKVAEEATRQLREKKESLAEEIKQLNVRLRALMPAMQPHMISLIRTWCQMGEVGWTRLATFAGAVGQSLGKLPIPVDAIPDVTKTFAQMAEQTQEDKKDVLTKIYWDVLTVMNLGPDSLEQPFGYLAATKSDVVQQVLIEENPRLRSIVSIYMPPEKRKSYMGSLTEESKLELLQNAALLSKVSSSEIRTMDMGLRGRLKTDNSGDTVSFEMGLSKLIETLSPIEAAILPSKIEGQGLLAYKRSVASLAFLNEWPDEKLSLLISRASNDEVVTLLKVRPDFREKILALCPPMTVKVAEDELSRPDRLNDYEKGVWLESLGQKLTEMVELREVSLEDIFPLPPRDQANVDKAS